MTFMHDEECNKPCKICGDNPCNYMNIVCDEVFHICKECDWKLVNKWGVYIVCCADNTLYIGATNNLRDRIKAHNDGKGAKYTRGRRPVKLLFFLPCSGKSQALKFEIQIKKLSRIRKLELCNSI